MARWLKIHAESLVSHTERCPHLIMFTFPASLPTGVRVQIYFASQIGEIAVGSLVPPVVCTMLVLLGVIRIGIEIFFKPHQTCTDYRAGLWLLRSQRISNCAQFECSLGGVVCKRHERLGVGPPLLL